MKYKSKFTRLFLLKNMITVACSLLYEIANYYSVSISEFKELLQISQHLKNYPS